MIFIFAIKGNQRVIFDFEDKEFENCGVPDGMTIDIEGNLWVACYAGSCVLRMNPRTSMTCYVISSFEFIILSFRVL